MDILCKFLQQVGPKKQVGWGEKAENRKRVLAKSTRLAFLDFFPTLLVIFPLYSFIWHPRVEEI